MIERDNKERLEDVLSWQRDHDIADTKQFNAIHEALEKIPCKEDIKLIVDQSIKDNFTSKGALVKNYLVTAAVIIGAITTIAFGFKTMLAWVGINIIRP